MYKPEPLIVPKGIRYLTEWEGFQLPDHPCIIDKKLTGCGFTEYVIRSPFNAVLISPRTSLLKNKVKQHNVFITSINEEGKLIEKELPQERVIYYARAKKEKETPIDKDLEAKNPKVVKEDTEIVDIFQFKKDLKDAISSFILRKRPIKICVTYDSFRKVKEVLQEMGIIKTFHFIVDEFQVIFTDSRFKPDTELEFVTHLKDLQRVSFVSATPYMEEYLDLLDDFKDLPFYVMDWESDDKSRIITPELIVKSCQGINSVAKKYITEYQEGNFDKRMRFDFNGNPIEIVEAKELVFYVNSIRNICDIIKQNKLTPEIVNVICADTTENRKKIREAFKAVFKLLDRSLKELPSLDDVIGEVPIPDPSTGEVYNKPITLCTKTVYLGADFYSLCARSIVLSDSGIESLAVDITLDLPQILGRQRLIDNPWKNSLEIWVKYGSKYGDITQEEFDRRIEDKIRKTENLLSAYDTALLKVKHDLADVYDERVRTKNYKDDYVAVNRHKGTDLIPQMNQLVMISEKRAFRIQKDDYKDRFSVLATIFNQFGEESVDKDVQDFIDLIDSCSRFRDKIRTICNYLLSSSDDLKIKLYPHIPEPFKTYYFSLGPEFIISVCGERSKILEAMKSKQTLKINSKEDLAKEIQDKVKVGDRKSKSEWKDLLKNIYTGLGISKTPKASDLEEYFELKSILISDPISKKRSAGFEIIKQK